MPQSTKIAMINKKKSKYLKNKSKKVKNNSRKLSKKKSKRKLKGSGNLNKKNNPNPNPPNVQYPGPMAYNPNIFANIFPNPFPNPNSNTNNNRNNIITLTITIDGVEQRWEVDQNGPLDQLYILYQNFAGENYRDNIVHLFFGGEEIARFDGVNNIGGEEIFGEDHGIEDGARLDIQLEPAFINLNDYLENLPRGVLIGMLLQINACPLANHLPAFGPKERIINNLLEVLQRVLEIEDRNQINRMNIIQIIELYRERESAAREQGIPFPTQRGLREDPCDTSESEQFYFPELGINQELRNEYNELCQIVDNAYNNAYRNRNNNENLPENIQRHLDELSEQLNELRLRTI